MNTSSPLLPAIANPTDEERSWLSPDHCAGPVIDLLSSHGWTVVATPEANIHATSPDGRAYVGWLPEIHAAWQRGIVWSVAVAPTDAEPWFQEFGINTPSKAVAGFITALVARPSR